MPLQFSGASADTISGVSIRAIDQSGKQVAVMASHEVIQDHGLDQVQQVASDKYDRGRVEANGTVVVRAADFQGR